MCDVKTLLKVNTSGTVWMVDDRLNFNKIHRKDNDNLILSVRETTYSR